MDKSTNNKNTQYSKNTIEVYCINEIAISTSQQFIINNNIKKEEIKKETESRYSCKGE